MNIFVTILAVLMLFGCSPEPLPHDQISGVVVDVIYLDSYFGKAIIKFDDGRIIQLTETPGNLFQKEKFNIINYRGTQVFNVIIVEDKP